MGYKDALREFVVCTLQSVVHVKTHIYNEALAHVKSYNFSSHITIEDGGTYTQ